MSVETNVTVTGPIIIVGDFNITSNRTVVDFQNPGVTVRRKRRRSKAD